MSSVFLIGATGYVGGQILAQITRSLPDLNVTALVRDPKVADRVSSLYSRVRVVLGDLDNEGLIEAESSKASVVLNAGSSNHMRSANAIQRGLSKRGSSSYWIQMSGASLLGVKDTSSPDYDVGLASSTVYDDVDRISDIQSLIRAHPSREMDNLILNVSKSSSSIKTALVLPPIIYGKGEGPGNQRSIQIPSLAKVTLEKGHPVRVGSGLNRWGGVYIADVAQVFVSLLAEAVKGNEDESLWSENGLYLTSSSEHSFGDLSNDVGRVARDQGLITRSEVEELSKEDSGKLLPGGPVVFGSNARGNARRAMNLLGWKPTGHSMDEEIPRAVAEEASRLGLT